MPLKLETLDIQGCGGLSWMDAYFYFPHGGHPIPEDFHIGELDGWQSPVCIYWMPVKDDSLRPAPS